MRLVAFLTALCATSAWGVDNAEQLKVFLKENPAVEKLIVIEDGKADFGAWDRFDAKIIDGDHVHVPQNKPQTKKIYRDFRFCMEFKLDAGANSGFFLRYPGKDKNGRASTGYAGMCELQVLDDTAPQFAKLDARQYHASAYGIRAAKRGFQKPVGEWNFQTVEVIGHRIKVVLNGEVILDADVSGEIKPFQGKKHEGRLRLEGYLLLAGHAEGVYYRNMYISEVKAPAKGFGRVKEIFSQQCISCHNSKSMVVNGGNLSMESLEGILKGGNRGPALIPGKPEESLLYKVLTHPESDPLAMPPAGRFPRMNAADQKTIHEWIQAGAVWPKGEKVSYQSHASEAVERELVKKIRQKILETQAAEKKAYTEKVEGIRAKLKMVPIPAGEITMKGEKAGDEYVAELDGFWMADKEIPWDFYTVFMEPELIRDKDGYPRQVDQIQDGDVVISQPSPPYHAMSFGMSVRRHPAIAMTQHAANKFCQWLSWQTGHFYRLPTEAEWEYAARAGVKTKYPWGDEKNAEAANLVSWYSGNSNNSYHRLGRKQANAWGLFDMNGNVMEWTLDAYAENRREALGADRVKNPWIKATNPYPHVCKGGHWSAGIEDLAFSKRTASSPQWKASDPQIPKSIWYHTNIMWIGFRPVRPEKIPSEEEMYRYWNSGVAQDQ